MTRSSPWRGVAALAVLFGPHAVTALADAAELAGADLDRPGLAASVNVSALSLTAAGMWLLVRARRSAHRAAVWAAAGLSIAGLLLLPVVGQAADTAAAVLLAGAGAWLCAEIARDADEPLWRGRPAGGIARRWDKDAVAACAVVLAGHTVAMLLDGWITRLGPAVADQAQQADATGLHNPVLFAAQALTAGVREEIPLLALPAALMTAARRPGGQILAVVCVLRVIPHAYLGTPALTTAVFAGTAWWMYRATRRVGPIIIGHTLFNAIAIFGGPAGNAALLATPAVAGLLLADAPNAAPAWFRQWLQRPFHRKPDRGLKVKLPVPSLDVTILDDEAARRLLAPMMDLPERVWAYASAVTEPGGAPVDEILLTEISGGSLAVAWIRSPDSHTGASGHLFSTGNDPLGLLRYWESLVFEMADLVETRARRMPVSQHAEFGFMQAAYLRWEANYGVHAEVSTTARDTIRDTARDHFPNGFAHDLGDLPKTDATRIAQGDDHGFTTPIPPGWGRIGWDHTRPRTHPILAGLRPHPSQRTVR